MGRIVIVGGGWAGAAAALAAVYTGTEVILLERTDLLLGTGLVGGIMRNNGRFTATEEMIALGAGDLFKLVDQTARHRNIYFPGHNHATLYDIHSIEPAVRKLLMNSGVSLRFLSRVTGVKQESGKIQEVIVEKGETITGDVFVDATGTAGPMGHCRKFGNGCAMCALRCPSFGGRISLSDLAGVSEITDLRPGGRCGSMSGSFIVNKHSLSTELIRELNEKGYAVIPVPPSLQKADTLSRKACQQYALPEYVENVILLDTGQAKLMAPFFPLERLRQIAGLENARIEEPYAGGIGNSIRFLSHPLRNDALQVEGMKNLFCAGEKAGLLVGHTEAIVTGSLAGHNAARYLAGSLLLELPSCLACGDLIRYVREQMCTPEGRLNKYTFSGSVYFQRMVERQSYSTDVDAIVRRVTDSGLEGVFRRPISPAKHNS
ncbi:FAD-dependent oxidoreductase [Heliobacterium chlorum]|uniref:FAD-dependent oxidoreductase n=1 Tax=Heliobacterium chlorum TaxID=2698 RepID=A0ABR7T2R4_HELCL|nr:FAD-dependent oxidoreductase [Heliobacterium chlorum]MBC9784270.1 FAD-dependent oxidoreductase [Heliobacterium chlorum]